MNVYGLVFGTVYGAVFDPVAVPVEVTRAYVDTARGDDANDGSLGEPFATLGRVDEVTVLDDGVVSLRRGQSHTGRADLTNDGITFRAHGIGDLPEVDLRQTLSSGGWAASGTANVYQRTVTRNKVSSTSSEWHHVWEDETHLTRTASLAACSALAGSYYASDDTSVSCTLYLHPTGSTDPATNGRTYKADSIHDAIDARNATDFTARDIKVIGGWDHYGGIATGQGPLTERVCVVWGGPHHIVSESLHNRDIGLYYGTPGAPSEYLPFTAFHALDISGLDVLNERIFIAADAASQSRNGGFYGHGNAGRFASLTYRQCAVLYGSLASNYTFGGEADQTNVVGCYSRDNALVAAPRSVLYDRSILRGHLYLSATTGSATAYTKILRDTVVYNTRTGSIEASGVRMANISGSLTIENSVVYVVSGGNQAGVIVTASTGPLAVTIRNSVIVGSSTYVMQMGTTSSTNLTYTGSNNVYVPWVTAHPQYQYRSAFLGSLAQWMTATGETNSARMTAADFGATGSGLFQDPANGDFRIKLTAQVRDSAGTQYPAGQMPDGTSLALVGPQNTWNWRTRRTASGPPVEWPTAGGATALPQTPAEFQTYLDYWREAGRPLDPDRGWRSTAPSRRSRSLPTSRVARATA